MGPRPRTSAAANDAAVDQIPSSRLDHRPRVHTPARIDKNIRYTTKPGYGDEPTSWTGAAVDGCRALKWRPRIRAGLRTNTDNILRRTFLFLLIWAAIFVIYFVRKY